MSGTNPIATWQQTNYNTQTGTAYPLQIDANTAVAQRIVDNFAPHQQSSPGMTVAVDAGHIYSGTTLTEVAAQTTSAFTAPTTHPRIDRIVIDRFTGTVSVITGTEATSPTPPAITGSVLPVAQVLLQTATTAIINAMITDERDLSGLGKGTLGELNTSSVIGDNGSGEATILANQVTNGMLGQMASQTIKGNSSGSTANASDLTLSQVLDFISSTRGSILYRGASGWASLPPGSLGQLLEAQGAGADPQWSSVALTGRILQIVETFDSTYTSSSAVIPYDNSPPQNTEGVEFTQCSTTITPMSATSVLIVDVIGYFGAAASVTGTMCLFRDSNANATKCATNFLAQNVVSTIYLTHKETAGSTTTRTYKMRWGPNSNTMYINGNNTTPLYGTGMQSGIRVTEVLF